MVNSSSAPAGFKPGPGPHPHVNGNGKCKPRAEGVEPTILPLPPRALAIVRLILGKRVAPGTRSALTAEWSDLAEFVESSERSDPERLWRLVRNQYLKNLGSRHPETAGVMAAALEVAWRTAADSDPGDEPDPPSEPPAFTLEVIDSATFFGTTYTLTWLVQRVLVAMQPCIIGGPKKTLKTSVLIDLAISLATATRFLGEFAVGRPLRVGFFSGESGPATIKDTALRVCEGKGVSPSQLGDVVWGFRLPQLSQAEHLAELSRVIRERRLEVVIIDPLYLCLLSGAPGRRLDASNLFDMGPLLSGVTETCLQAGATPLLVHHFKKNRESPYDTPELEDLAFAGIQEFARQWLLIGRRERFEPGSGAHRLWLTVGGSAGHSGDWAVDIDEGVMDDEFQGRRWGVTVRGASEARTEVKERGQNAKAEREAERSRAKAEAREREDAAAVVELLGQLKREPERRATVRRVRNLTGWGADKAGRVIARAEKAGYVRPAPVEVLLGRSKTSAATAPGYEWAKDPWEAVL